MQPESQHESGAKRTRFLIGVVLGVLVVLAVLLVIGGAIL